VPLIRTRVSDFGCNRFGNYIGEEPGEDEEVTAEDVAAVDDYLEDEVAEQEAATDAQDLMDIDQGPSTAVVLHEDKQYYPTAQQVYGADVETLVQEEDTQDLSQPIIAPVVEKKFAVQETDLPDAKFSREFMSDLMIYPDQARNVAIAGHFHHGKTAFMDMLVMETHRLQEKLESKQGKQREEQLRYTDTHPLERARGISIKATPMSLVLKSTKGKSHLFHIIDTPGHVNFADEVAASLRITDGVVLVVDVIEGVQANTELIIRHAINEELPMVLVVNKMDRLILELKLPPADAYYKLKHVIEEVNTVIENIIPGRGESRRLSPEKGNVAFACTTMGWCFTLKSFAKKYQDQFPALPLDDFAMRMWGDIYWNSISRKFSRKPLEDKAERSFIKWILTPIYKLYSHGLSDSPAQLKQFLAQQNIELKPSELRADARVLLKLICGEFFGPATGFVDMVVQHIPSVKEGAKRIVDRYYTGPIDSKTVAAMKSCDQDGPLVIHVTKLFNTQSAQSFTSFGRILSGTAKPGTEVRVLGEGYSPDDEEDMVKVPISETWLAEARYQVPVSGVPAGNLALLGGVDNSIVKTATIVASQLPDNEEAYIFRPIKHFFESVFKVAVEPLNPSELPKMLEGLRKIAKSYPLVTSKVEESGEHIVLGTGELCMDCVLHDLRRLYAEMEVKVSDPVTRFSETCVDTTDRKYFTRTPNKKNKITMLAESLDPGIAEAIEQGKVKIKDPVRVVGKFFEENYGYDLLASRNIWAFGPSDEGPNILQNDTLPSEIDPKLVRQVRDTIKQGFQWATREGPLCEEPIRNVKFRLTDLELAPDAILRGGGQMIPTTRRACYAAFLKASPRLMEPIYHVSVVGSADSVGSVYTVLARRRGHVLLDHPIAGTPIYQINGLIPVIDSFGFETDLKILTQGQASVSLVFDRWNVVPGDPLDTSVRLTNLEPASANALARDFVLKTRRRKGLAEEGMGVRKYLEKEVIESLMMEGDWEEVNDV